MCYVKLLFVCNHSLCRTLKAHEGNQKRCRCNKVTERELTIECLTCKKENLLSEELGWLTYTERPNLPDTNEGNKMALIDYKQLINDFRSEEINQGLLQRFKEATEVEPHRFLRRGIVFSHRDLEKILDLHETGKPFFVHAGRGPSSPSMHLGHVANFEFAKWLSAVFKQPLVILLSDGKRLPDVLSCYLGCKLFFILMLADFVFCRIDEKHARDWSKSSSKEDIDTYLIPPDSQIPPEHVPGLVALCLNNAKSPNTNSDTYTSYAMENAKDIIATGSCQGEAFFHVNSTCMSHSMVNSQIAMKDVRGTLKASI